MPSTTVFELYGTSCASSTPPASRSPLCSNQPLREGGGTDPAVASAIAAASGLRRAGQGGRGRAVTFSPGSRSILSSSAASGPPSLPRWTRSCSSAAERATPPRGWKYQSRQRKWPGRRSKSYDWYSFNIPKNSNKKLPATMLWWLCSSFLTSDALIQAPAICTCLEGKCWPSIPRPDTNRAHFNVNNPPWRGSMINVSFSCHGLIPNLGDTAFHCKLLSQELHPVLPHKPRVISHSTRHFSFFDLLTLHFADTSSTWVY